MRHERDLSEAARPLVGVEQSLLCLCGELLNRRKAATRVWRNGFPVLSLSELRQSPGGGT
jgi:hypothetical protein